MSQVVFHGVSELRAALDGLATHWAEGARAAVAEGAHLVERKAKQNAPVVSGTLRRSIRVLGPTPWGFGGWSALIGPSAIYGRRVELGFHGADSLGRNYDQK